MARVKQTARRTATITSSVSHLRQLLSGKVHKTTKYTDPLCGKRVACVWVDSTDSERDSSNTEEDILEKTWNIQLLNGSVHSVHRVRMERLLGPSIANWTLQRPSKKLSSSNAFRWGLTELAFDGSPGTAGNEDWPISKVVLGNGSSGFQRNCYYGCDDLDTENWHLIHLHTARFEHHGRLIAEKLLKVHRIRKIDSNEAIFDLGLGSSADAIDKIDEWCTEHPGCVMNLCGPGAREKAKKAKYHYTKDNKRKFCSSQADLCSLAALMNSIAWRYGIKEAENASENLYNPGTRDLAAINGWMQRQSGFSQFSLQKVESDHLCSGNEEGDPILNWLMNQSNGIFLVRIMGTNGVDHMISIDIEDRVILDCMEKRPMVLSEKAVKLCVGDENVFTYCREVRKLRKLPTARRTEKAKRPLKTKNVGSNNNKKTKNITYCLEAR